MNVRDILTDEVDPTCPSSPAWSVCSYSSTDNSSISRPSNVKRGWIAPFLLHLRQMLRRENSKIIRWTEDGMAFCILDKEAMTSQILPKYFKNKNFSSFQRQLNYFGFRKWSKSRALFPTYSREHFTRDNYGEMSLVKRQTKKSCKRKAIHDEEMAAKRAAMQPMNANDKCKPILPRPQSAMAAPHSTPPLMQSVPVLGLPVLSSTRKVNSGYKLPSIHELSILSAMSYVAIHPIRPRLMT